MKGTEIWKRQRKHLLQFVLLQWWPWIIYSEEEIFTVSQSQLDQGNSTFGKTILNNVQVIDKGKVIHQNDSLSHWGALIKFWTEDKKTLENFSIYWASSSCNKYCVGFRTIAEEGVEKEMHGILKITSPCLLWWSHLEKLLLFSLVGGKWFWFTVKIFSYLFVIPPVKEKDIMLNKISQTQTDKQYKCMFLIIWIISKSLTHKKIRMVVY